MKTLLLTAALLAAAVPAKAMTIVADLGLDPTSATGDFAHSLGSLVGKFQDDYLFHLDHADTLAIASAINVFPVKKDFIGKFTGTVFEGTPSSPGPMVLGPELATLGCGAITKCQSLAGSAILGIGTYFLQISGVAHGSSGYGGNLATIAPTPVPAALPMFLGGLGVLGWMVKRGRRRSL